MRKRRQELRAIFHVVLVGAIVAASWALAERPAWAAKNVILMIADGAGHNSWLAAEMYQGRVGREVYDQPGWIRLSCSTYPLSVANRPTGNLTLDPRLVYDPAKAWDTAAADAKVGGFAGYLYLTTTATDSAASATAMATGRKTYNAAINWSNDDRPMHAESIAERARANAKSAGVVTTVPWSDATPAALGGAHSATRDRHAEIANEMLASPWLDVIMGAGNPDFDGDGKPLAANQPRDHSWVGGQQIWQAIKSGKRPWRLIEAKADFEALAEGPTPPKVLGVAQVAKTLQEQRKRPKWSAENPSPPAPFAVPANRNLPTLAAMTKAALNCLDDNPRGFYLMVEGGAVDWANHANEPERMIEEQIDFTNAVGAVVAWVESHGGWSETLVILTADHECGMLWGPESDKIAFQPLSDRGKGNLPGMKHNSHGHSNSLVPLYARGPGSHRFVQLAKGEDKNGVAPWQLPSELSVPSPDDPRSNVLSAPRVAQWPTGKYIDNTDIFAVMRAEVEGAGDGGR